MGGLTKPFSWFPSFIWVPPGFVEALIKYAPPGADADCKIWDPYEKGLFKHLLKQKAWKNFKLQTWMHLQAIDDCLMDAKSLLDCQLEDKTGFTLKGVRQDLRHYFCLVQRIMNVTETIKRDNRVFSIFWDQAPMTLKDFLTEFQSTKPTNEGYVFEWENEEDLLDLVPLTNTFVQHFWDFWVTYGKHLYFIFSWIQIVGREELTIFSLKNFEVGKAF